MLLGNFAKKFWGISTNIVLPTGLNFRFCQESIREDAYHNRIKELWGSNFDFDKEKLTKSDFYNKFLENVVQMTIKGNNLKDFLTIANFIASNPYRHSSSRSQRVFFMMIEKIKKEKVVVV